MIKDKVYLCGAINGQIDSQAMGWREQAKRLLCTFLDPVDPMTRDYRGREASNVKEIIEGDLQDIQQCKYILANCSSPSWGTAMEIAIAHSMPHRPIAIGFGAGANPSPWLIGHTSWLGDTLEQACKEMIDRHKRPKPWRVTTDYGTGKHTDYYETIADVLQWSCQEIRKMGWRFPDEHVCVVVPIAREVGK